MDSTTFIKQFPIVEFKKGDILLHKDSPITHLFAIRTGYIKAVSISSSGDERLTWLAGRYDIVPTEQLFSVRGLATFYYVALTDGSYYSIDKPTFITACNTQPSLMKEVAYAMTLHYDDLLYRIDSIDALSVRERLTRTLLYLAKRVSAASEVNMTEHGLILTHTDLAAMIGAARETTSHALSQLRSEKAITYNRKEFIIHTKQLSTETTPS